MARRPNRVDYTSRLEVTLPGSGPFAVVERLEFDAAAPQRLIEGSYTSGSGARARRVNITRSGDAYTASVDIAGVRSERVIAFDYTLADLLGLELWLSGRHPPAGAMHRVRGLDFERLAPVARSYRVVERRADGYAVANAAPLDEQVLLLDERLIPRALSLAGLFTMTRATAAVRDEPNRSRSHADYNRVALAGAIPRPTEVRRLTLDINQAAATALTPQPGLTLATERGRWSLVSDPARGEAAAGIDASDSAAAALDLPDDDPRLLNLLERARRQAPGAVDPLAALTNFVHGYLEYDEASHSLGLLDTLQSRRGDCTEFADLLTALARAAGYRARTVTGLVYADDGKPAFMLHAWSEVQDGKRWRGLDPTWNEVRLDATHLPLPDSDVGYLRAYAALPQMRFEVRSIEYF
jgi:transglutaminase-like putative cysteine protease